MIFSIYPTSHYLQAPILTHRRNKEKCIFISFKIKCWHYNICFIYLVGTHYNLQLVQFPGIQVDTQTWYFIPNFTSFKLTESSSILEKDNKQYILACNIHTFPGLHTLDPPLSTPIDTSGNFSVHMS